MQDKQEETRDSTSSGRIDTKYACWPLTAEESQACESVVTESRHSVIYPLPNHYSDEKGQQRGFLFECIAKDCVSAMPIGNDMFSLQCLFECRNKQAQSPGLHKDALAIFNDIPTYQKALAAYMAELEMQTDRPAAFDCICEDNIGSRYTQRRTDERPWRLSVPARVGLFHAFVRTHMKDRIEHKERRFLALARPQGLCM